MAISAGALCAFAAIVAVAAGDAASDTRKQLSDMRDDQMSASDMKSLPSCYLAAGEDCPVESMPSGKSTLVYPGGDTRCLSADEPEFAVRASVASLVLRGRAAGQQRHLRPEPRGQPHPLRGWTIVNVLYCSGDLHMGMVDNTWGPQRGFANTLSALGWAMDNFPSVGSLLIAGGSAGSLAAQLMSGYILNMFDGRHDRATVVADSLRRRHALGRAGGPRQAAQLLPDSARFGRRSVTSCHHRAWQRPRSAVSGGEAQNRGSVRVRDAVLPSGAVRQHPEHKTEIAQITFLGFPAVATSGSLPSSSSSTTSSSYTTSSRTTSRTWSTVPSTGSWSTRCSTPPTLPSGPASRGLAARPPLTDWLTGLLSDPTLGQGPNQGGPSGSVCLGIRHGRGFWARKLAGVLYCDRAQSGKPLALADPTPAPPTPAPPTPAPPTPAPPTPAPPTPAPPTPAPPTAAPPTPAPPDSDARLI